MKKQLAVGNSSFAMMMKTGSYYIDKTDFIKVLMKSGNYADLITRPRRFGKTLFLDTLYAFLRSNPIGFNSNSKDFQKELFAGLSITKDKAFCEEYMGKQPVLFLTLKDVAGQDFNEAFFHFADLLAITAQDHAYLLGSPCLTSLEKQRFEAYMNLGFANTDANRFMASKFLRDILAYFARHFGKPAVLLIDEYDVPLAKAASGGYYDAMSFFMRSFFAVLKPDGRPLVNGMPILGKAVLTGCLRVGKESFFTGVNNVSANTVCTDTESLAAAIGFTENEVNQLLRYYDLESRKNDVRRWYDGYRFGSREIFCPWDVLNFCQYALESRDPQHFAPKNYWSGTT